MASTRTPSELLEIRRVRAMASSAANTPENNCFKGDKGDTGPPGEKGDKGDQGIPGPQGLIGPSGGPVGPKGDRGEKGDKGDKGDQGTAGTPGGPPGPDGPIGPEGPRGPQGPEGPQGQKGDQGIQGVQGVPGIPLGNVLIVDTVTNPNQVTTSHSSIHSAISAIVTGSLTNQTIWLLPGTHYLQNGISIPNGCSIRGMSAETVKIQMLNSVTANTTMIIMGENTSIEGCTIHLTSTAVCNLTGILFFGTSTITSKIRGCYIYLNNFSVTSAATNVIGILANGPGISNTSVDIIEAANAGSLPSIENSTIQIISNYMGTKRGISVSGGSATNTNIFGMKNTSVFIKNPTLSPGGGSWSAVENNSATSKVRCFTSILAGPTTASYDDYSDIAQTDGEIAIGEGTTLLNKRSKLRTTTSWHPFKVLTNTTRLFYAALGKLNNFTVNANGYLLPGTTMIQNYTYPPSPAVATYNFQYPIPTTNIRNAYYTIPQRSILMSARVRLGKAQSTSTASPMVNFVYIRVYYDTAANPVTGPGGSKLNATQLFVITLNDTVTDQSYLSSSGVFILEEGGQLRVSMSYAGGTGNLAEDLYVELELY